MRVFLVTCNSPHDGTAAALTASVTVNGIEHRVPRAGDDYLGTTVNSIEADPKDNSDRHFEVTVESSDADESETFAVHPLDRPPEVTWTTETTEPCFIDVDDEKPKPVTNSAGDPFDQFLERECGEMVITVAMNVDYHDAADADLYSHRVNREHVTVDGTTYAPGTLKLSPIQATRVIEIWQGQELLFYRRVLQFKARRQGWDDQPIDLGVNELVQVTEKVNGVDRTVKKRKPIMDSAGLPVRKSVTAGRCGQAQGADPGRRQARYPQVQGLQAQDVGILGDRLIR